jgi:hypothetical protein
MRIPQPINPEDIQDIRDIFFEPDISIISGIYYFDGWSDYEECGGVLIFQGIDDSIQCVEYGYCVMVEDHTNYFDPFDITEEEMELMIAEIEDQIR